MSDIVERLRHTFSGKWNEDAADEIERLRAENERLRLLLLNAPDVKPRPGNWSRRDD